MKSTQECVLRTACSFAATSRSSQMLNALLRSATFTDAHDSVFVCQFDQCWTRKSSQKHTCTKLGFMQTLAHDPSRLSGQCFLSPALRGRARSLKRRDHLLVHVASVSISESGLDRCDIDMVSLADSICEVHALHGPQNGVQFREFVLAPELACQRT